MKKEFTFNIIFLVAINLAIKPFYALVIDTTVQNRVGPESYGIFLALFNFVYIQQIFADLGLQSFNNIKIARDPKELKTIFPKVLGTKIVFIVFFFLIILLTAPLLGYAKYLSTTLGWIIGSAAGVSLILYFRSNISGIGKYFTDSIFSVLDKVILIGILSYLLWISPSEQPFLIIDFVKAQFLSVAITLAITFIYTHLYIIKIRVNFDWTFSKNLIRQSLPYATLILLMAGYSRLDGIMLEQLMSDNGLEAGKYASAFRLYDTWNGFTFLFAGLLLPMFTKLIAKKQNIRDIEIWAASLLTLGSIFMVAISVVYGREILDVFYTREMDAAYVYSFKFLMIAGVPLSLIYIYSTLLTANGNLGLLNKVAIGGFLINLVLNVVFIPYYGAIGAALTTLFTQWVVFILQYLSARRIFELRFNTEKVIKFILLAGIVFVLLLAGETYMNIHWVTTIVLTGMIYTILAFLLKLIKKEDLLWKRTI